MIIGAGESATAVRQKDHGIYDAVVTGQDSGRGVCQAKHSLSLATRLPPSARRTGTLSRHRLPSTFRDTICPSTRPQFFAIGEPPMPNQTADKPVSPLAPAESTAVTAH